MLVIHPISATPADSDADGRPTLIEYVLGSSPTTVDHASPIDIQPALDGWAIGWTERRDLDDARIHLQSSSDLRVWVSQILNRSVTPIGDDLVQVSVTTSFVDGPYFRLVALFD